MPVQRNQGIRILWVDWVFAILVPFAGIAAAESAAPPYGGDRIVISRADLRYDKPVVRSEEGMPIGNGRMGTLVWTVPSALRMQINRVDVFANGCSSHSFFERNTDYCGGCGFVDIDFGVSSEEVFPSNGTTQHLSCYDGIVTVEGQGVTVRAMALNGPDVIVLQVDDRRTKPEPISVNLRMLRPRQVRTRNHLATSRLESREGRGILTQKFEEDKYFCGSAVAVGVVGRKGWTRQVHEQELGLVIPAANGKFTVMIASAAGFDKAANLIAAAESQLDAAISKDFDSWVETNKVWWRDFWSRSSVRLHSDDGVADKIEQNYTYYLYIMASSSRGKLPPKFNGMLWNTDGDTRRWGAQFWGANQSCIYNALFPANRPELMDPTFNMYSAMADSLAVAARQQWGSRGIYIPETVAFDGLDPLPDDIATEMRELYLLQKPWDQVSTRFREYALAQHPNSSRWNWQGNGVWKDGQWQPADRGGGPYGPVTHIFSRGAKIAYWYWLRYEYTMDAAWLLDRAYPILKGVAEFYRNYPNVKKGADGKYHIHHVNSNESIWGGRDTDEEIASMMGILPVVIRASEILELDAEMRQQWREFLENLAPLPRSDSPEAPSPTKSGEPATWIRSLPPIIRGQVGRPDANTMPIWFFDLCTLENADAETMKIANATYDAYFPDGVNARTRIGVLSKVGVTAAMMGRADHVKYLLPNQIFSPESAVLANRMDLREGVQTMNVERLGRAADTLHTALCQSIPAAPGKEPVIRVFPAWPKEWDAEFTLLARGAFLVSSSMKDGQIGFVEIRSRAGGECRIRNPWPNTTIRLSRNGKESAEMSGSLLVFKANKDEIVQVVSKGVTMSPKE
jgi:hypothetical protein